MKSVVINNLILQLAKKDRIHRESMLIRSIKIDVTIQRRKLKRYEDWRALKYTNKKSLHISVKALSVLLLFLDLNQGPPD